MEAMPHIPDLSGPTKNHVWASALLKDFNLDEDQQINHLTKQPTSQSLSGTIKSHKKKHRFAVFDQRSSDFYIYSYDKIIQFLFSHFKGARGNESILLVFLVNWGADGDP